MMWLREQHLRALCERNIGPQCPKAAEDMMIVLAFRGMEPKIIIPPYPAPPFAVMLKDGKVIDRVELPL